MPFWLTLILTVIGVAVAAKIVFVFSLLVVFPVTRGAMFHPSAAVRVRTFVKSVPMRPGELLVDIGCGDGRVLRAARSRYGVRALGFEINPLAYSLAKLKSLADRNVEIRYGDFWKSDLSRADVIFCYLFPDVMERLAGKLKTELRPGARVVSCNFTLPGWTPFQVLHPDSSLHGDPIYVYHMNQSRVQSPASRVESGLDACAGGGPICFQHDVRQKKSRAKKTLDSGL
ncbi:MAG: class I SAM-dependent methyltransferase [Syntrophales bacterium]|nr:class I SAM-dependent methyltransferase [Syntrophales bacterium]MDD5231912.1 class I SAM-dependent methyltransferase [Syntrophales bacterium]MDD5531384.1 class I SAM-dependent methyltransferase [Syntrophales bacterium]